MEEFGQDDEGRTVRIKDNRSKRRITAVTPQEKEIRCDVDESNDCMRAGFASRVPYFQFKQCNPRSPTADLPMKTYDVSLPGVLGNDCSIELDVLLIDSGIPSTTIERAETFARRCRR